MKKIYILTAVFALLTLSLNAQMKANKKGVVRPTSTTEKVVTPPDGYFRMGPSRASSTPVTPPYSNSFGSNDEWNWWEAINNNNDNRTWTYNSSGYAQYQYSASSAADDWLVTAPVTLQAGRTYKFYINAWVRSSGYPEKMEVKLASTNTATALSNGITVIGSTELTNTSSATLSNENVTVTTSGNYYFGIHCFSDADQYYLYVDDLVIDVEAVPEHDLAIALSAEPATVSAGDVVTLTATVTNTGDYTENGYTVTFTANGNTINTQTGSSLAAGASATFTTTYTTTDAQVGTNVNFGANVALTDDADASNNEATASSYVLPTPPPENVQATGGEVSGTMTWSAPSNLPTIVTTVTETVTEGFDDTSVFPSFSIGGITDTEHTGTIGDWTVYEPTGDYVYAYQDASFTNAYQPQAWTVFDPSTAGTSWTAHSTGQYMLSFCSSGDENGDNIRATDHWLISPELSGNAQTISFWERVITTNYGNESYEVWVSSTDNNPASFTKIKDFSDQATTWTQRSADLPAGTKYFAIRHTSNDVYGMMIDDVTYEISRVVETPLAPVSYNVYLDGELVGSVPSTDFSYNFTNVSPGEHQCAVSAVYAHGESEAVPATFTSTTPDPELIAPTDGSTVNVGTNPGAGVSTTITVNGYYLTGDLTISVEGTGFSVEPTTISAADANAGTTITVTYNGYSSAGTGTLTITSSNGEVEPVTVNLTGNFVPQPIEPVTGLLRLHLLLVDQLKANIPDDNSHADAYRYVLKYEPTGGETKESSPVKVDIHKTECEVKGYYTKAEIDGDTDGALTMDVLTADVEFDLTDDDNTIDFYNLQGKPNEYPALGKDYLTKLQQTTGFVYYEMLEESPNKGDDYPAGLHHYYDDSTPILTGTYTNGFMSYAPSLSTWGVARRYFEDDGLDNTYGAPIWRTRVGKVEIQGKPAMQKQVINAGTSQEANNPHTTWTVGNKTYCLYFLGVNAQGTLPRPYATDYPQGTNIKYEPYMFRVFVSSPTGKLRKFDRVLNPNGGGYEAVDVGPIGPNEKYCVGSFYKNEGWHADDLFFSKTISAQNTTNGFADDGGNDFDPYAWDGIMKFGAEDGISASDVKVWVRMYYMVEGWDATRDGEARPGNGSEGSGDPDDPSTFIYEFDYNAEVVGVTYVNAQGMTSDKPFDGMNIVVTKFSDGTTTTTKVMR